MSSPPEPHFGVSRRLGLLVLAGLACGSLSADELRKISRLGEAPPDAALTTLLGRMRRIVADRDYRSLEALMNRDFRVEFDVGKGPRVFRRHWRTESHESPVWSILQRLLSLGGSFCSPALYVLPFFYQRFPIDLDPLRYVVPVSEDIPLLAKPETEVEPIGRLECSIIPVVTPMEPPVILLSEGFIEVSHPTLGRCFVAASDVYSPAGHRAFFERRNDQWRWISLAAATLVAPSRNL